MKCFDTDWEEFLRWLEVWESLSVPARRHFLNEDSSNVVGVPEEGYGADLARVLDSGLAARTKTGTVKPTPAAVRFWRFMRHLRQFPVFDEKPTSARLQDYVLKHYTYQESQPIQSPWHKTDWDSEDWPRAFLRQKDYRRWEARWLTHEERLGEDQHVWQWDKPRQSVEPKTWFPDAETAAAAKALVQAALDSRSPLPLTSLAGLLPAKLRPFTAPALKACLRFLLLYPALRTDSLEAVVGLCPVVAHLRNRPPAIPPAPRPADGLLSPAFLMEDMTRVLALAAAGECQLTRSSYETQLFKKVADRLRGEFISLPAWIERRNGLAQRLAEALQAVHACKFANSAPDGKRGLFLQPTSAGRHWLSRPPADRLHDLLLELRKDDGRNHDSHDRLPLVPWEFGLQTGQDEGFDARAWLDSIWREGATEAALPLDDFLDYHARISHPLISPAVSAGNRPAHRSRYGLGAVRLRIQNIEEVTRELLAVVFWKRLVPLGCVATSTDDSGETIFRLSSAGRCFFGLDQKVDYGQPVQDARVVVQPNFEIVFLHPNLMAEIDFTPFAERCGQGVGTLFRLTRRQSLRAASEGLSADAVLDTLARHSSSPVPANVAAELRAWFGSCRTLVTRRVLLIEAGDAETALRTQKLLGPECVLLGETLIEWSGDNLDSKLRRKLADHGIFIQT